MAERENKCMITLWDCRHAKIGGQLEGYSGKVHAIDCEYGDIPNNLNTLSIKHGKPLRVEMCQACPHFEDIGEPLPKEERGGW